jgi:hypothetical protein
MCEPTLIAMGVSTALALQQKNQASKQANGVAGHLAENVVKATVNNYTMANRQAVEERGNASVKGLDLTREVARRRASAITGAAASGAEGLSVDALLLDLSGKGLEAGSTSETNYARTVASQEDQRAQIESGAQSAMNGVSFSPGLGIGDFAQAGAKAGGTYYAGKAADTRAANRAGG